MKSKKYNIVGTVPRSNIKIVERGNIYTPNTQIHDRSLFWLGKKPLTMVVYNPPTINKTNNHLWPQIIEHKKDHMTLEIQILAWDSIKTVNGIQHFPPS